MAIDGCYSFREMLTLKASVPWRAGVGVADALVWSVASKASVPK